MKYFGLIAFCLMAIVGCHSDKPKSKGTVGNANGGNTPAINTTDDMPVYRVATTGKQPPFSYKDEYGNVIGMDIDIMNEIAKEQGFKVEFDLQPWHNIFPSVASSRNHLAISGISYSDERNEQYALSKKYLFVPSAIMVTDPNINTPQDLNGKRFNCMTSAKQCEDIKKMAPTATVTDEDTTFTTFVSLVQGRTDAIGEDMQLLQYFAKKHPDTKVYIYPYETEDNPQSSQVIMTSKNREELIAKINEGIDKLHANGKIKEIEKQWLENPR